MAGSNQGGRATSDEPTYFELEREKLIGSVSEQLGKLISSLNVLNRKIEASAAVGNEFQSVSTLWTEYARVIGHSQDDGKLATKLPPVQLKHMDTDATNGGLPEESFGLAPGAGSTSYMR